MGKQTQKGFAAPSESAPRPRRRAPELGRWALLLISYVVLVVLAGPTGPGDFSDLDTDRPLIEPFRAPFDLAVEDELRQMERLDEINRIHFFRINSVRRERSVQTLKSILELARDAGEEGRPIAEDDPRPAFEALVAALKTEGVSEDEETIESLAKRATTDSFRDEVADLLIELYDDRGVIAENDLAKFRAAEPRGNLRWMTDDRTTTPAYKAETLLAWPLSIAPLRSNLILRHFSSDLQVRGAVESLLLQIAEPNIEVDTEEKRRLLGEAEDNPEIRTLLKGETIAAAGSTLNDEQRRILAQFESRYRMHRYFRLFGIAVFVAMLFALIILYARKFPGETPFTSSGVALIALPTIAVFGIWRILERLDFDTQRLSGFGFGSALIGMLGVALLGPRLSWLLVLCAGLLYGVATEFNFVYAAAALFGGFTAITSLYATQTRRDILVAGIQVGLVNALVILTAQCMIHPDQIGFKSIESMGWGLTNGILCGVFALPLLWTFEKGFGVVTDYTLLELTGIHHPLLRKLEEEAPGSFQHTLNVAKLAEAAATAIGANYLLVRAGSLFHDVGKVKKMRYYSENQLSQEDRALHSKLSPHMSTLIIKNHVKEGLDLGRQYDLPPEVLAFIPEHQGTSLISYFHNQAIKEFEESESTDPVREEDFRYPGPKPQSVETAIVMLADSVEATVTSVFTSTNVNEDELRLVVRRSVNEKFSDGQLDECDLTLRDLHVICETFVKTLLARFHHRVAYPDDARGNGNAGDTGVRRA